MPGLHASASTSRWHGCRRTRLAASGDRRSAWLPILLLAQSLLLACGGAYPAPGASADGTPRPTTLRLDTAEGSIDIQLLEEAAPVAVQRLKQLLEPPAAGAAASAYDGLAFDFTRPHIEIITATPEPSESLTFPTQIDAERLGLDRRLVSDTAEAMSVVQRELLMAHQATKKGGRVPPKLERLLAPWFESYSADYLIGTSWREINEAMGYVYQSGLDSRPAVRGSVLLDPISPTLASGRLAVLLADIPARTGRWMVIGEVTDGLEVAQAISVRPRVKDRRRQFRPVDPVVIDRARLIRDSRGESASDSKPGGSP